MHIISCSKDIKLYSCPDYQLLHTYSPSDNSNLIKNISWCKDGSWLSVVPSRGSVKIIKTEPNLQWLQSVQLVQQPTVAMFQKTTKKNVAIGNLNGAVLVYDIKARSIKKKFAESGSKIRVMDWSIKDTHLATGNVSGHVILYSNTTNQRSSDMIIPQSRSVTALRFSILQRSTLAAASDEGVLAVYDINTNKCKLSSKQHQAPVRGIAFSTQNSYLLASCALDRTCVFYDLNRSGEVAMQLCTEQPLTAVDLAPEGSLLALGSIKGNIYLYDLRNYSSPIQTIAAHDGETTQVLFKPCFTGPVEKINITAEKTVTQTPEVCNVNLTDSFSKILNGVDEFSMEDKISPKMSETGVTEDSFLMELGNIIPVPQITVDYITSSPSVTEAMEVFSSKSIISPLVSNISQKQNRAINKLESNSSTPILSTTNIVKEAINDLSAVNSDVNLPRLDRDELRKIIKEVLTESTTDILHALSRITLSLQMTMAKNCVDLETRQEFMLKQLEESKAQIKELTQKLN